jgi:hypothetical protein
MILIMLILVIILIVFIVSFYDIVNLNVMIINKLKHLKIFSQYHWMDEWEKVDGVGVKGRSKHIPI